MQYVSYPTQIKFVEAGAKGDYFLDKEETGKGRSILELLNQRLKDPSVAIVVIDSLNSVVSGGTRTTNDGAAMQRIIQGLFDLAKAFKVTILLLHHTNKKGQDAVFKGMRPNASMVSGAAAITNIPRQVTFVLPLMSGGNPDPTWKQVITIKTNCTKATGPLYFRTCMTISPMGKTFVTGWNEYQPPGELVTAAQADDPCIAILRVLRNSGEAGAMWTFVERDLLADEAFTISQLLGARETLQQEKFIEEVLRQSEALWVVTDMGREAFSSVQVKENTAKSIRGFARPKVASSVSSVPLPAHLRQAKRSFTSEQPSSSEATLVPGTASLSGFPSKSYKLAPQYVTSTFRGPEFPCPPPATRPSAATVIPGTPNSAASQQRFSQQSFYTSSSSQQFQERPHGPGEHWQQNQSYQSYPQHAMHQNYRGSSTFAAVPASAPQIGEPELKRVGPPHEQVQQHQYGIYSQAKRLRVWQATLSDDASIDTTNRVITTQTPRRSPFK
ncbi:hypothetical protein Vretifemale_20425 [Volvox reticuliferus]|uniref:Uncharacterized protein n=1 Tax=Volvox reticuliferus TaxID=1737510 RepID=A0A8J4D0Z1_9CHLO|nr:hypothetical protein Vretifemale_20425 [Volvox reticuliferus]